MNGRTEITGKKAVKLIMGKMWHHLPNGTCMNCGKSYTGGVYKQISNKLMCEWCVTHAMILNDATSDELMSEKRKAASEK